MELTRKEMRRLSARMRIARLLCTVERCASALFPALAAVCFYLVLGAYGFWAGLHPWLHAAGLAAALAVCAAVAWKERHALRLATSQQAARWLESVNHIPHHLLAALDDRNAIAGDAAERLWQLHRTQATQAARGTKLAAPRVSFAGSDPWGLRYTVLAALAFGLLAGSATWRQQDFLPSFSALFPPPEVMLNAWIQPPEYTGLAPLPLQLGARAKVEAPEGSTLTLTAHTEAEEMGIVIGGETQALSRPGQAFTFSGGIPASGAVTLEANGREVAEWDIALIADIPPVITLPKAPETTPRRQTVIFYDAKDDYGITEVKARLTLDTEAAHMSLPAGEAPEEFPLALPMAGKEISGASYHDLTELPLAGMPVVMVLEAKDAKGNTAQSQPMRFTLPTITFTHPVAQAIADQRALLGIAPEMKDNVAVAIAGLAEDTPSYDGDPTAFLALDVAHHRLMNTEGGAPIPSTRTLLWRAALHVEFAGTQMAEAKLHAAFDALKKAMAENKDPREIEKLMRDVRVTMRDYMRALARQNRQNMQNPMAAMMQQMLPNRAFQDALKTVGELYESGSRDQARQMVEQLERMMAGMQGMAPPRELPPELQKGLEALKALQEMVARQRELLDATHNAVERGRMEDMQNPGAPRQQSLREQLAALQKTLEQLKEALAQNGGEQEGGSPGENGQEGEEGEGGQSAGRQAGSAPGGGSGLGQALGRAARAMERAVKALGLANGQAALGSQGRALQELQQEMQSLSQALRDSFSQQQGGQGMGMMPGGMSMEGLMQQGNWGRTIFGDTPIPEKSDLQKSREVLQELYRRSGDRQRGPVELEYIERLLERF